MVISVLIEQNCETGIEKRITRVAVSATTAAASDASAQGLNMAVRNQEEYDLNGTLTCSAASAITTAAQEGKKMRAIELTEEKTTCYTKDQMRKQSKRLFLQINNKMLRMHVKN